MDFATLASEEITALLERLSRAAAETRDRAVEDAQAAHADALKALAAEHEAALQQARTQHDALLQQAIADHEAALEQATSGQDARFAESQKTHEDALTALQAKYEAALAEMTASHEAAVKELTASHDAIVTDLNDAQQQMAEHARRQLAVVTGENNRLMAEFAALERKQAELAESQVEDTRGALLAHLGAASAAIAASSSPAEVLIAVADGLSYDFSRVVALEVRDQRLEAIHQHGFGDKITLDRLSAPRQDNSLLSRALQTPDVRRYASGEATPPPFAGTPHAMLTMPILVHGEPAAIIYADAGVAAGAAPADDCATLAALLRQQAVLRLDRLAIELKAAAELRAYARMLIDEVEYVFNADVAAGKGDEERLAHLQENIRCARQIFTQRVTTEGPASASLLDDVMADRLRAQSGSAFARDLGHLLLQGDLESTAA